MPSQSLCAPIQNKKKKKKKRVVGYMNSCNEGYNLLWRHKLVYLVRAVLVLTNCVVFIIYICGGG